MYIDEDYVRTIMRPGVTSGSLVYGGVTLATTGSVMANAISRSCSYVDAYLAGSYSVPVENPPENLKEIAAYRTIYVLFLDSNTTIPASLERMVGQGETTLMGYSQGVLDLPGIPKNTDGAHDGGHTFSDNGEGVDTDGYNLRGKLSYRRFGKMW